MKVAVPLAKHILVLLGITAAASAISAGIQKKKKKTWFRLSFVSRFANNNLNNLKQKNEWHNKNCSSS